ncbi:helix-turn-helix domain-containing protein [Actinomadura hibisca]|uniref:helix-turn-helix domain-containing protein n=1 Tax=Actinomadura hibisca TaxID=68565 RepID=UPI00082AFCF8|nr:AraC family transcriptional regulator [Actinomadura hibisca]
MDGRSVASEDRWGWRLATAPPHPALRPFLRSYDGYWEHGATPSRVRTLPSRTAVLIINLGPPMYLEVPGERSRGVRHGSFATGLHSGPGLYAHPGGQRGVQLNLTPFGVLTLLGVPPGELADSAACLTDLLGSPAAALVARLGETPGWAARFALLDRFLLDRLERGPVPDPEVARAWELLARSGGRVPVADLAAEVGWSRRHLACRFRAQVGLTPKVTARVLRFERAAGLLAGEPPGWAELALSCGYCDQAHLNREFRALAGCTPTGLLAEWREGRVTMSQ